MKNSSSKEKILKKIREALSNPVPLPFPKIEGNNTLFSEDEQDLEVLFAEEFNKLMGNFAFCMSDKDAHQQIQRLIAARGWKNIFCAEAELNPIVGVESNCSLSESEVSFTTCHYLVARTGAIVLSSAMPKGRTASVYAPIHICIAYTDQLVFDTRDALKRLKETYGNQLPSSISFAAGPSRTADIEKTLVVGVHGPKEVYVFLIDRS